LSGLVAIAGKHNMSTRLDPQLGDASTLYVRDYYRRQLHHRHWFRDNSAKRELRWQAVLRMIAPARDDIVLDLGCAAGEHAIRLAPHVARVVGIDSSRAAIDLARERAKGLPNVEFVQADATALDDFADDYADKVMAIDFVEHIVDDDLDRLQYEVFRVLKPGGRVALYTPCGSHYVERMKAHSFILKQIPGHIAVRAAPAYDKLFSSLPWRFAERFYLPSTYPLFGHVDRALGRLPGIGALFRFRFCLALQKRVAR
jgi:ubiquinone/menaquinone biosynthesis C-methylase UbiE